MCMLCGIDWPEEAGSWDDEPAHRAFIRDRIDGPYPPGMGYWVMEPRDAPGRFLGWILLIPEDAHGPEIETGWRVPAVHRGEPYVGLVCDASGHIVRVVQRREGESCPAAKLADLGIFFLRPPVFGDFLSYARDPALGVGRVTEEKNFLPFFEQLHLRGRAAQVSLLEEVHHVAINTPEELAAFEGADRGNWVKSATKLAASK